MIEIETVLLTSLEPDLLATLAQLLPGFHVLAKLTEPFERRSNGRIWCFVDWLLPDCSGLEMCRRLRAVVPPSQGHITMVLEDDDRDARRRALRAGADDYLVGPLTPQALVARLQQYRGQSIVREGDNGVVITDAASGKDSGSQIGRSEVIDAGDQRRFFADYAGIAASQEHVRQVMAHGELTLDLAACQAYWRGMPIALRPNEFRLLAHFVENTGKVLSRTSLIARIGKEGAETDERTVDVWVGRLRRALKAHGVPDILRTVRSFGYVLDKIEQETAPGEG
ncbi:hypothetical protein MB02_16175 [Croceicoccus estronivorus]|uniref:winged helix-turn-helix transcriptional regulator n=1 Tax=Croceicoccus estronivorus TaxID=1172626 RepID=UPI00082E14A9|nr:response regulator transcription factor [Croceicoccus estronivorus]OCC22552.1 hypothetical protein MB02_16175 [Croceicoccus estronivorus]